MAPRRSKTAQDGPKMAVWGPSLGLKLGQPFVIFGVMCWTTFRTTFEAVFRAIFGSLLGLEGDELNKSESFIIQIICLVYILLSVLDTALWRKYLQIKMR